MAANLPTPEHPPAATCAAESEQVLQIHWWETSSLCERPSRSEQLLNITCFINDVKMIYNVRKATKMYFVHLATKISSSVKFVVSFD